MDSSLQTDRLTESQLQQIEKRVYEIVPIRKNELTGIGFCASRKREINALREVIRKNLIRDFLKEKVEQNRFI